MNAPIALASLIGTGLPPTPSHHRRGPARRRRPRDRAGWWVLRRRTSVPPATPARGRPEPGTPHLVARRSSSTGGSTARGWTGEETTKELVVRP